MLYCVVIFGVPRHREPSGLRVTPSPQSLTSTFSIASPLFSHFYSLKCPVTLLTSDTCALLRKQRRGATQRFFPNATVSTFVSCITAKKQNQTQALRQHKICHPEVPALYAGPKDLNCITANQQDEGQSLRQHKQADKRSA